MRVMEKTEKQKIKSAVTTNLYRNWFFDGGRNHWQAVLINIIIDLSIYAR